MHELRDVITDNWRQDGDLYSFIARKLPLRNFNLEIYSVQCIFFFCFFVLNKYDNCRGIVFFENIRQ